MSWQDEILKMDLPLTGIFKPKDMIRTTIRETLSERKQSVLSLSNDSGVRYPTLTEFINTGKGISIDNLEKVLSSLDLVIVDSKSVEALSGELKKLL